MIDKLNTVPEEQVNVGTVHSKLEGRLVEGLIPKVNAFQDPETKLSQSALYGEEGGLQIRVYANETSQGVETVDIVFVCYGNNLEELRKLGNGVAPRGISVVMASELYPEDLGKARVFNPESGGTRTQTYTYMRPEFASKVVDVIREKK